MIGLPIEQARARYSRGTQAAIKDHKQWTDAERIRGLERRQVALAIATAADEKNVKRRTLTGRWGSILGGSVKGYVLGEKVEPRWEDSSRYRAEGVMLGEEGETVYKYRSISLPKPDLFGKPTPKVELGFGEPLDKSVLNCTRLVRVDLSDAPRQVDIQLGDLSEGYPLETFLDHLLAGAAVELDLTDTLALRNVLPNS